MKNSLPLRAGIEARKVVFRRWRSRHRDLYNRKRVVAEMRERRVSRTGERDEDMAGIKFLGLEVLGNKAIRRVLISSSFVVFGNY